MSRICLLARIRNNRAFASNASLLQVDKGCVLGHILLSQYIDYWSIVLFLN